ncbi:MAG: conjugative transposon protein TraM, partial [Bacteroidales bacterium]|nr:conjugative transposon protein TraM [Bacteroidales bacterium]
SMLKSWGKIDDYSAVGNIDRDDDGAATETYERQVSEAEAEAMESEQGAMPPGSVEETLRRSAERGEAVASGDYPFPLTESERLIQSQQREEALREVLEAALAQLCAQSEASVTGSQTPAPTQPQPESRAVSTPSGEDEATQVVKRIMQSSDYFHTVSENDPQPDLIRAIIDENIKAVDGSRVRLRLLDDVQIGSLTMPKGSYLYAEMNGFSGQRVKGTVKSVLLYDEIIRVSLSLYDTDGLEGLYVPRSTFNETAKDVASGAMGSNMTINQGSYNNSLSQWGMQAIQNAYQRTTSAVGKAIRRNSATLKYGTFVYLVNGRETRTE